MAAVLKLQRLNDSTNILVDELSLYNYEDNIAVANWIPGAEVDGAPVVEAMTLNLKGSGTTNFNDLMMDLDDKIQQVKHYREMSERYSVWLVNAADNERQQRRAFVFNMSGQPTMSYFDHVAKTHDFLPYTLTLERAPLWLGATPVTVSYSSAGPSGQVRPQNADSVDGTAPGRISRVLITPPTSPVAREIWMGLRSNQLGNPDYFDGNWDLGSDYHWLGDNTSQSGDNVVCAFAADDTALADRVVVRLMDAVSSPAEMRGEYQILMLGKVGSSTVCHVQLGDGLHATVTGTGVSETWNTHQRVRVDTTYSKIFNLGTVRIPPARGEYSAAFMNNFALKLAAQRTSGSGSLTMEKLILIPRSEGYLHIKNVILTGANVGSNITIYQRPEGSMDGYYIYESSQPSYEALLDPYNWAFPLGDNGQASLVLAADCGTSGFNSSLRLNVTLTVYPRYRTMKA